MKFLTHSKNKVITFISVLALCGLSYLAITSAASNPDCGTTNIQNYVYQVPFGNAVWNQKVCDLPKHARSDDFSDRLFNWSRLSTDGSKKLSDGIGFGPNFVDVNNNAELYGSFNRNVYYASDATTTTRVWSYLYGQSIDSATRTYKSTATIPWNPDWITGQGGDNEIVILDESNGRIYELANYILDPIVANTRCVKSDISQGILFDSISQYPNMICTGAASLGRDLDGNIIDYRTFEGVHGDRGLGLSKFITFTMPEEILAGEIRHALGLVIPNTDKGPVCTEAQKGTTAENVICGTAWAPATKFEFGTVGSHNIADSPTWSSIYDNSKLIPEGMRFALDIDDNYINNWIQSREDLRTNPRKAETARIVARALRDYGFIIADTGGGVGFQVAGTENPDSRQKWNELGLYNDSDSANLLDGLVQQSDLFVVEPPTVTCKDGRITKYYCRWTTATYDTAGGNPNPAGKISDFDGDNKVTLADLAVLLSKYNNNVVAYKDGDCDGNGYVNLNDLAILLSNYGK